MLLMFLMFSEIQASAQTISLHAFLEAARADHPLLEQEELSEEIVSEYRYGLLGAMDWHLSGSATASHTKPIVISSFSPTTIDRFGINAQLRRSLWSSGGKLSLGWSSNATNQTLTNYSIPGSDVSLRTGFSKLYENSLSLLYTQPLLRNFKGKLDRLEYDLAAYDEVFTHLQAIENEENFLLKLAIGFIDWVLLEEKRSIAEERVQLAIAERELTTEMQEANLVERIDVLRAEDAVRLSEQNHVLTRSKARAKQEELAVLAALPELRNMRPDYDLYSMYQLPSIDTAVRILDQHSRVLHILDNKAQQLQHLRSGAQESGKPSVNAGFGLTLEGDDDDYFSSLELDRPDLFIGLDFSHPLGSRTARSEYERTSLELRQVDAETRLVRLELQSQMHSLLIQMSDLKEILELNREQIGSAHEKTAEERRLYEQGRSELNFVIQAEDNEGNARLTYAVNAAEFHRLYHQYLALCDMLRPTE